jgi:hypothetical protein
MSNVLPSFAGDSYLRNEGNGSLQDEKSGEEKGKKRRIYFLKTRRVTNFILCGNTGNWQFKPCCHMIPDVVVHCMLPELWNRKESPIRAKERWNKCFALLKEEKKRIFLSSRRPNPPGEYTKASLILWPTLES